MSENNEWEKEWMYLNNFQTNDNEVYLAQMSRRVNEINPSHYQDTIF